MNLYKKFVPHLLALISFMLISLVYFSPVLSGKVIYQSDIVQYTGMAKEQIDFRVKEQEEPYWTNSAFGGMPTYQLGAKYPHNYIKAIDSGLRFLPRPADYLFLYFAGFYLLLISLGVKPLRSVIGALAFGFSTYLIIILGVGHNAKAHAIAYMPMLVAGVLLVFRKKYVAGGILTAFAAALEISANHFQMTYYLLFLLLVIAVFYTISFIKQKDYKGLSIAYFILMLAAVLSIGANATNLLATSEYSKFSTRAASELSYEPDGSPKTSSNAMSYDYITEYSYGIFESLNLIVPGLTGGANNEALPENSNLYKFFTTVGASPMEAKELTKTAPTYWGDQPIVAAPAYIGAVVFFLFVLGLFTEKRNLKYIFLTGTLLSLFLSWGKNFSLLTDFFINYVPLYDKFRAVSSIQVILELCMPALAMLGLYAFAQLEEKQRINALKKTSYVVGGIFAFLFLIKGTLSFSGLNDAYYRNGYGELGPGFIKALIEDRKAFYTADLLRSIAFVGGAGILLWCYAKNKIQPTIALVGIGVLIVADLVLVDKRYVNDSNFVAAHVMERPFEATPADKQILSDPGHFRVFEMQGGFNSARTSFFHNSLGGYHAAKPRRIQQIMDYQISERSNMEMLNMMNVKYIIRKDEQGQDIPLVNPSAHGNAWFVSEVIKVASADEEMKELDKLNTKEQAVINAKDFNVNDVKSAYVVDSLASIQLVAVKPNELVYSTDNPSDGFAVFSEVYYPHGWKVTVDGEEVEMLQVDYVLRGLELPKGKHKVIFKFEPQVIQTGSRIALLSFIVMLAISIGAIVWYFKSTKETNDSSIVNKN